MILLNYIQQIKDIVLKCLIFIAFFANSVVAFAQGDDNADLKVLNVENHLTNYYNQVFELSNKVSDYSMEQLDNAGKILSVIDAKCNMYCQSKQDIIASDEQLLTLMADYQLVKQAALDSINIRKHRLVSLKSFRECEIFVGEQDTLYSQMYKNAQEYSLVEKLAPQLEQLKAKEQIIFAQVEKNYQQAKAISGEFPILHQQISKLEEEYIHLKSVSEKIQSSEYKPFIQRIKDYLMSLAAVAILFMFVNMIQSKIQMYRQLKKSAQEYKDAVYGNNDREYPTI